jgi:hypothetical protein
MSGLLLLRSDGVEDDAGELAELSRPPKGRTTEQRLVVRLC